MEATIQAALIAGVVALVGSALSNFGAEMYKRHRDAAALAGGLVGELRSYVTPVSQLLDVLPKLIETARGGQVAPLPRMKRPTSPVYESRVGDLGLLGPALAERVAYVHGMIEAFRNMMEAAIAPEVTAKEQEIALTAALELVRRAHLEATPLITALHRFAAREPLEPF